MLSLASRAEPYRCCSRAVNGSHSTLRLLATCRQDARIPVLLLQVSLLELESRCFLAGPYGLLKIDGIYYLGPDLFPSL